MAEDARFCPLDNAAASGLGVLRVSMDAAVGSSRLLPLSSDEILAGSGSSSAIDKLSSSMSQLKSSSSC